MAQHVLFIGNRNYSTWSLRAWLGLKLSGLAFAEHVIPMGRPESAAAMKAVSPTGAVPALRVDDVTIWDSLAICEYAAEMADGTAIWPDDRMARAVARAISAEMHDGYRALRWNLPMNLRRAVGPTPLSPEDSASVGAEVERITKRWATCQGQFGKGGDFLFGRFTLADAMYAPVVTRLDTYAIAVDGPTRRYMDCVLAHPLMTEWRAGAIDEPWTIAHSDR